MTNGNVQVKLQNLTNEIFLNQKLTFTVFQFVIDLGKN